jgi:hypothetical protein
MFDERLYVRRSDRRFLDGAASACEHVGRDLWLVVNRFAEHDFR